MHDIAIDKAKFFNIKGTITGKAFMEDLTYDLLIHHEIKHLSITKPTFEKYIEVDSSYRKVLKFSIPDENIWDKLCELIE